MAPGKRRVPWRLVAVVAAAVVLVAFVLGLLRAVSTPPGLSTAQFEALATSGSVAGIKNSLLDGPARPTINLEQQKASYLDVPTCTTYWRNAQDHLLDTATALPTDPGGSLVDGIDLELWDDVGSASAALTEWSVCLRDFQEVSRATSYPLKQTSSGASGEVRWQYSESMDLDNGVRLLVLQGRNVVATFHVPDGPASDWRDKLIADFSADIAAAGKS